MMQNKDTTALGPSSLASGGENQGVWDRERASPLQGARSEGGETGKPTLSVSAYSTICQLSAALASVQGHIFAAPESSRTQLCLS